MRNIFYISLLFVVIIGILPNYSNQHPKEDLILENGCLIYAIKYQYALQAKNILNDSNVWAKIIIYKVKGAKTGHAVTVYVYRNFTYIYDPAVTSYLLAEYPIYDPYKITKRMHPFNKIEWAQYVENVFLYNP